VINKAPSPETLVFKYLADYGTAARTNARTVARTGKSIVSQRRTAKSLSYGQIFNDRFVANLLANVPERNSENRSTLSFREVMTRIWRRSIFGPPCSLYFVSCRIESRRRRLQASCPYFVTVQRESISTRTVNCQ